MNIRKLSFAKKLDLCIQKTKFSIKKIDNSRLEIFEMVIIFFLIDNKAKISLFFNKIFLFIDISIDIALEIIFFILRNAKIYFTDRKLNFRLITPLKALPTI